MPTKGRLTIGTDPLDAATPTFGPAEPVSLSAPGASALASVSAMPTGNPRDRKRKVRATFHLPEDLLDEARDAVVQLSGPPYRLTLAEFAETAFRREVERLRQEANEGAAFPKRVGELRGGRQVGK